MRKWINEEYQNKRIRGMFDKKDPFEKKDIKKPVKRCVDKSGDYRCERPDGHSLPHQATSDTSIFQWGGSCLGCNPEVDQDAYFKRYNFEAD